MQNRNVLKVIYQNRIAIDFSSIRTPGVVHRRYINGMVQGLRGDHLDLLGLFAKDLQGQLLVIEESGDGARFILNDKDFSLDEMLWRAIGEDLIGDVIELDKEVFRDRAGILNGEDEIQIQVRVKGTMKIVR